MNLIMRGFHTALEPLRYKVPVKNYNSHSVNAATGAGETLGLIDRFRHRRRVIRAERELSKLSDETLRDIGVERGNIPDIVGKLMNVPVEKSAVAQRTEDDRKHDDFPLTGGAAA